MEDLVIFQDFIEWLFSAVTQFLMSPPILYVVCCIIVLYAVKIFKQIISFN